MPEILTESFCERCGTRYTFESATPRGPRLKGLKVMSRGLRNFVLSDDTSMDEAMAAARNETDREQTAHQLDAFHKTFNFCMSCRQYTCGNCWNEAEGRCLSCAPHLGHEVLPAPFSNIGAGGAITLTDSEAIGLNDRNGHDAPAPAPAEPMAWPEPEPMAWPTSDLMRDQEPSAEGPSSFLEAIDAAARLETLSGPAEAQSVDDFAPQVIETQPVAEEPLVPVSEAAPAVERLETEAPEESPVEAEVEATAPEIHPAAEAGPIDQAASAAANTTDLLHRFRPGQSIDDELAAFEREQADAAGAEMAAAAEAAAAEAAAAQAAAKQARADEEAAAAAAQARAEEAAAAAAAQARAEEAAAAQARADEAAAAAAAQARADEEAAAAAAAQARADEEEAAAARAAEEAAAAAAQARADEEEAAAAGEARDDLVFQPTWQIVAPEAPTSDGIPPPTPAEPSPSAPSDTVAASAEPQWPAQPEWPRPPSAEGLPFLGRPAAATGGIEALWAESAREVATVGPASGPKTMGGVQPCVSCGLSLSANARFCRRCGTRQG
jgi:hypothetical protein